MKPYKPWSLQEENRLRELAPGFTLQQLAEKFDRTENAIKQRCHLLGVRFVMNRTPFEQSTAAEREKLTAMARAGYTNQEMIAVMGKTRPAVMYLKARLGLNHEISQSVHKVAAAYPGEDLILCRSLIFEHKMPLTDVSEKMEISVKDLKTIFDLWERENDKESCHCALVES